MRSSHRWFIAGLAAITLLVVTRPVIASNAAPEPGAAAAHGVCSADSTWEVTMNHDIGIEMEVHLETGVPDQPWTLRISYDGDVVYRTRVTTEPDGGFEVRRQVRQLPGVDRVEFLATNDGTGEVCTAGIQYDFPS